jgi:hypothetical protein
MEPAMTIESRPLISISGSIVHVHVVGGRGRTTLEPFGVAMRPRRSTWSATPSAGAAQSIWPQSSRLEAIEAGGRQAAAHPKDVCLGFLGARGVGRNFTTRKLFSQIINNSTVPQSHRSKTVLLKQNETTRPVRRSGNQAGRMKGRREESAKPPALFVRSHLC